MISTEIRWCSFEFRDSFLCRGCRVMSRNAKSTCWVAELVDRCHTRPCWHGECWPGSLPPLVGHHSWSRLATPPGTRHVALLIRRRAWLQTRWARLRQVFHLFLIVLIPCIGQSFPRARLSWGVLLHLVPPPGVPSSVALEPKSCGFQQDTPPRFSARPLPSSPSAAPFLLPAHSGPELPDSLPNRERSCGTHQRRSYHPDFPIPNPPSSLKPLNCPLTAN